MKRLIYIFMAIAIIGCNGAKKEKTGFTIKGSLSSIKTDSVYIYVEGEDILTSAPVVAGKFELKGSVSEPLNAALATKEKSSMGSLILENADYTYTEKDKQVVITGGSLHDLVLGFENTNEEYAKAVADYEKTSNDIFYEGRDKDQELTDEEDKLISEKMEAAIKIENDYLHEIIVGAETSALAKVFAVARTQDWERYPTVKRIELLHSYDKELPGNKTIAFLLSYYESEAKAREMEESVSGGNEFKDIEAVDMQGNVVKLSEVIAKNKFTILEFWASWCGPCRGEVPNLKKAYEKYKSKGLEIYSISLDDSKSNWLKALEEEDTSWINVIDEKNFKGEAAKNYGINAIPASFLIGQDGIIRVSNEGLRGTKLDETLSEYLK